MPENCYNCTAYYLILLYASAERLLLELKVVRLLTKSA